METVLDETVRKAEIVDRHDGEDDRNVEVGKSAAQMAAALRRGAEALEAGKGFRMQIGGSTQVSVPESASLCVQHERACGSESVSFCFEWPTAGS